MTSRNKRYSFKNKPVHTQIYTLSLCIGINTPEFYDGILKICCRRKNKKMNIKKNVKFKEKVHFYQIKVSQQSQRGKCSLFVMWHFCRPYCRQRSWEPWPPINVSAIDVHTEFIGIKRRFKTAATSTAVVGTAKGTTVLGSYEQR